MGDTESVRWVEASIIGTYTRRDVLYCQLHSRLDLGIMNYDYPIMPSILPCCGAKYPDFSQHVTNKVACLYTRPC